MSAAEALRAAAGRARAAAGSTGLAAVGLEVTVDVGALACRPGAVVVWDTRRAAAFEPEIVVGFGVAGAVVASGHARWAELRRRAGHLLASVQVAPEGPAPRLFGAGAFSVGPLGMFAPFGQTRFVLPRWTFRQSGTRTTVLWVAPAHELADADRVAAELAALLSGPTCAEGRAERVGPARVVSDGRGAFASAFGAARAEVESGAVDKVVLARAVELEGVRDAGRIIAALESAPSCVRFAVRHAEYVFVGATPEQLVSLRDGRARTEAVAGTEPRRGAEDRTADSDRAEATALALRDKDRREHDVVVRTIRGSLSAAGCRLDPPAQPRVRTLRDVHHLVTPVSAEAPPGTHVLDLVAALHPTPALGGSPAGAALALIEALERAPRGLYGGPIGWFDARGCGDFAVAIRSALVSGDRASAFAGVGIVQGSVLRAELLETDAKLSTMLSALGAEVLS